MERTKFPEEKKSTSFKAMAELTSENEIIIHISLSGAFRQQIYNNIINKNIVGGKHQTRKIPIAKRNDEYQPIAEKLYEIIRSHKKIIHPPRIISAWANQIRRIEEENGIDFHRIKKALEWYKDHVGDDYVPVIESGGALREKFLKLESAMNRKVLNGKKPFIIVDGLQYDLKASGMYVSKNGTPYIP